MTSNFALTDQQALIKGNGKLWVGVGVVDNDDNPKSKLTIPPSQIQVYFVRERAATNYVIILEIGARA